MQEIKAGINVYCRFSIIEDIKKVLKDIGENAFLQFSGSYFGHFMEPNMQLFSCNVVLHSLIAHNVRLEDALEDEVWFLIGEKFI